MMQEVLIDLIFNDKGEMFDFNGFYLISNMGYVKSIERNDALKRIVPTKKLYGNAQKSGHKRVTLYKNGKKHRFLIHRLVAIMFIKNCNNKPMVAHLDNDPSNNKQTNLYWATAKENSIHMVKCGRSAKGDKNGMYNKKTTRSKLVLDMNNGVFYYSIGEAAQYNNVNKGTLADYLRETRKNKLTLKLV